MTNLYRTASFIVGGTIGRVAIFLCLALLPPPPLAIADPLQSGSSSVPPEPIRGKGYRLVQDWDFGVNIRDETELRQQFHTRYIYNNGRLDHLADEWTRYRDNANHVFLDGNLALVARVKEVVKAGEVESGMLRSKWSGQYGYFEIRMKVPRGRGLWLAFWLGPEDKRWPPEIDVVEIVNNGRDTTLDSFHFLHGIGTKDSRVNSSRLNSRKAYRPGFDFADDFHNFAVEWTEEAVRHYVDGCGPHIPMEAR
jgi:hypothetical protein